MKVQLELHSIYGIVEVSTLRLHQLELFFYVAKHGGISAASRHMPYGIGQPAISGQMIDFERQLGARLFDRKPFRLTEQGMQVFAYIRPFFEGLGGLWLQLQAAPRWTLRIAADEMIGARICPGILSAIAFPAPGLRIEFQRTPPASLKELAGEGGASLAITISDRPVRGLHSAVVARLGLRLLVAKKSGILTPADLWKQDRIAEALIYPVAGGEVQRAFERGLRGLRVDWPASLYVDSLAVMRELVAAGRGIGLDVDLPEAVRHPGIRTIPLTHFETVPLTLLWRRTGDPVIDALVGTIVEAARKWYKRS